MRYVKPIFASILILLSLHTNASSLYNPVTEQNTVNAAFKALQWFQLLYAVSKKCNHFEYTVLAPREELETLITEKLKVNIEKIEVLAEENTDYMTSLYREINSIQCDKIDLDGYLSFVYDKYDVERFSFELFEPLATPMITAREAAYKNQKLLAEYAQKHATNAKTILIANLIPREQASERYLHLTRNDIDKPKYIYQIVKGWGQPLTQEFMKPPLSTILAMHEDENKEIMSKKGKIQELIFVNSKDTLLTIVTGSINLDLYPIDLSFLKNIDWKWHENELQKHLNQVK